MKAGDRMTANQWRAKIRKQMEEVGTFKPSFNSAIDALAKILEQRDAAHRQFVEEGSQLMVMHTHDRGKQNRVKNPLLVLWDDLNKTALTYWRDLGLTPKGLKAIDEAAMKPQKQSKLDKVLNDLCS